jgi:hypothetical protein
MPSRLDEARSIAGASMQTVRNTANTWLRVIGATAGKMERMVLSMTQKLDDTISKQAVKRRIKLEVRKGMFMNSLIVDEFTRNRTGVIFKVEGKPRLRYMLKVEREIFSREIQVSAYIGTNHGRQASYWEWQQLPPQGWKKDVLLMKVWPEWTPDDFNANS